MHHVEERDDLGSIEAASRLPEGTHKHIIFKPLTFPVSIMSVILQPQLIYIAAMRLKKKKFTAVFTKYKSRVTKTPIYQRDEETPSVFTKPARSETALVRH